MNPQPEVTVTSIVEYSEVETALSELEHRYGKLVIDVTTPAGLKEAKEARKVLRDHRVSLEEMRKKIKAPVLAQAKLIDTEAERITSRIAALEDPIALQIKAEEERAKQLEATRIAAHQARIDQMKNMPVGLAGKTAAQISEAIETLRAIEVGEAWEEFRDAATMLKANTLLQLQDMHKAVAEQETRAAQLAKEREELERLRAADEARRQEEARQQAKANAEREAANREAAEKLAREKEAFEKEQAEARARQEAADKAAAEVRAKAEAESRAKIQADERAAAEARAKVEAEAREAEERKRKAREEEQARLAEIERQRMEKVNASELLATFVQKYGHLPEYAQVVEAIKALPSNVTELTKKAA